jgi:predicted porin
MMKGLGTAAASAAVLILGGVGGAFAADLGPYPVKAPVVAGPTTCTSILDFFVSACQLSGYGVRIYGTIDAGYGYQTNSTPFSQIAGSGVNYFPSKYSGLAGNSPHWLLSPNAMSQSNVGVQIKEAIGGGWSFVGQLETQFDPESLRLGNSSGSVSANNGLTGLQQVTNGDGSSQGKFYNGLGFAGVSHDTWGTLTFGRQTTLGRDAIASYDPMGGGYAFTPLGFYGAFGAYGLTEQGRGTTAIKYRVNFANYHFGAFAQVGGYNEGNAAEGAYLADFGGDWKIGSGVLSADVSGGYTKNAVTVGLTGGNITGTSQQFLTGTISDNTGVMLNAKYTLDRLKLYAGYEWIQYAPPSDTSFTSFTDIADYCVGAPCGNGTSINFTNYSNGAHDKVLQIAYFGARYSLTDSLDVAAAYYHEWQNDYSGGTQPCAVSNGLGSKCAGTIDAASATLDWKFAPKWDTYIGVLYSKLGGGLDSGFVSKSNVATTGGIRFRF